MRIDSAALEALYTLSLTRNFTRAAQKLFVTQSALSQRISRLEKQVGHVLVVRDRAGLRFTEQGERLLHLCKIESELEEEFLETTALPTASGVVGELRVGGFSSYVRSRLLPLVARFAKDNPRVRYQIFTREMSELPLLLKRGDIDYVFVDSRLETPGTEGLKIGSESNVLVQAKSYSGADIFLDHDENDLTTLRYLRKFQPQLDLGKIKRCYLDDVYSLLDAVKLGMGKAVLPVHLVKGNGDLVVVSEKNKLELPVYLYFKRQPYYSTLHKAWLKKLSAE